MNTKQILFASCVAAMTLSASVAMAGPHGSSAGGGVSGGGFTGGGGGIRGGAVPARMTPGLAGSGSRFGSGVSRNFRDFRGDRDRFRDRRFNDFVFFGGFGDPFFYPYYGYYPYGYYPYGYYPGYYPYGYYPYGYGYNQPVYPGVAVGSGSSVAQIQLRLARAGFYHGRIDGVMGPRTRYAMRAYERSHNSRVTAPQPNNSSGQ
jgi:Putative peptidoglycan binding domain